MSQVAEKAYQEIREHIQSGAFRPGHRLVERTLCAELGMSRTPVREALRMLTAEGLVLSRPRRGMVVARLSTEELEEIFEVGVVLESYIASVATRKNGGKPLPELRKIMNNMERLLNQQPPDVQQYIAFDREFHQTIMKLAANPRLEHMLRTAMDTRALNLVFAHYSTAALQRSLNQHETIVRAIESGDTEWAASAMRTHILSGRAGGPSDATSHSTPERIAITPVKS